MIYTKLNTPKQRASVRGLGFKKSDPVTMHQQHMKAWNSGSFALGRPSRDRGNQSARPRTALLWSAAPRAARDASDSSACARRAGPNPFGDGVWNGGGIGFRWDVY